MNLRNFLGAETRTVVSDDKCHLSFYSNPPNSHALVGLFLLSIRVQTQETHSWCHQAVVKLCCVYLFRPPWESHIPPLHPGFLLPRPLPLYTHDRTWMWFWQIFFLNLFLPLQREEQEDESEEFTELFENGISYVEGWWICCVSKVIDCGQIKNALSVFPNWTTLCLVPNFTDGEKLKTDESHCFDGLSSRGAYFQGG